MRVLAPMLLPALIACGTETIRFPADLWVWDSAEGGGSNVPSVFRNDVVFGCDETNAGWQVVFRTSTRAHAGELYLFTDDLAFVEVHPLEIWIDRSRRRDWREFGVGPLPDAIPEPNQVDGVNSALDCERDLRRVSAVLRLDDRTEDTVGCAWTGPAYDSVIDFLDQRPIQKLGCERFEM